MTAGMGQEAKPKGCYCFGGLKHLRQGDGTPKLNHRTNLPISSAWPGSCSTQRLLLTGAQWSNPQHSTLGTIATCAAGGATRHLAHLTAMAARSHGGGGSPGARRSPELDARRPANVGVQVVILEMLEFHWAVGFKYMSGEVLPLSDPVIEVLASDMLLGRSCRLGDAGF